MTTPNLLTTINQTLAEGSVPWTVTRITCAPPYYHGSPPDFVTDIDCNDHTLTFCWNLIVSPINEGYNHADILSAYLHDGTDLLPFIEPWNPRAYTALEHVLLYSQDSGSEPGEGSSHE